MCRASVKQPIVGFTIIEFLVYMTILVLVMASTVTFMFSLQSVITQYRLETELYRGGTAVLEQVVLALRQADEFDSGTSVIQPSDSGVLAVVGTTTMQFARVGSELQLTIDGTNVGDVTTDIVSVSGFTVYHYDTTAGDMVRVELELTATVAGSSRSQTFYGGSVLRGSL